MTVINKNTERVTIQHYKKIVDWSTDTSIMMLFKTFFGSTRTF